MNISDLRDLKLTMEEWETLVHPDPLRVDLKIVDILVLAGLAEWEWGVFAREEGEWLLTDEGRAACDAIDMIFDWGSSRIDRTSPSRSRIQWSLPLHLSA